MPRPNRPTARTEPKWSSASAPSGALGVSSVHCCAFALDGPRRRVEHVHGAGVGGTGLRVVMVADRQIRQPVAVEVADGERLCEVVARAGDPGNTGTSSFQKGWAEGSEPVGPPAEQHVRGPAFGCPWMSSLNTPDEVVDPVAGHVRGDEGPAEPVPGLGRVPQTGCVLGQLSFGGRGEARPGPVQDRDRAGIGSRPVLEWRSHDEVGEAVAVEVAAARGEPMRSLASPDAAIAGRRPAGAAWFPSAARPARDPYRIWATPASCTPPRAPAGRRARGRRNRRR
jgi:hypothetical protein